MANTIKNNMLALLIPALSFGVRNRKKEAVLSLILQLSLIGWIPAAVWALVTLHRDTKEKRIERVLKAVRGYTILPASKNSKELTP